MTDDEPSFDRVAAVDLGSNSFHMIVAREADGQLHVLDRLKEMVQLGAGLDDRNRLTEEAQNRAIDCLARFGERLRGMAPGSVRAVGTNTLRMARNSGDFLARAEAALGHPIEIIAGREEARLIYLGVSHTVPPAPGRRLVMDIGGGSTEFIIGRDFEPLERESLHMGCVSMSRLFFPDGELTARAFESAELAARLQLRAIEAAYKELGWETAIGASGTILAVDEAIRLNGLSEEGITLPALEALTARMIEAGRPENLGFTGVNPLRAPVFAGGVAVLGAAFRSLEIGRMQVSEGALREGAVYDLLGRIHHEDVRERTIARLSERYHISENQARRVEHTALECLRQVAEPWELDDPQSAHLLGWAARLHELGLAIAHTRYHRHGAYLVENSDLRGFSRTEQRALGVLIYGHRRRLPFSRIEECSPERRRDILRLCILLRLAVLLHRSRQDEPLPPFTLTANPEKNTLRLHFPEEWLAQQPLTLADLRQEAEYLKANKIKLKINQEGKKGRKGEA
ncbi:exopolyphosphatase [Endothiovibrio diazotrophicus]